jgi:hypothetical protein
MNSGMKWSTVGCARATAARGALVVEQSVDVSAGQRFGGPLIELADPAWRRLHAEQHRQSNGLEAV